MRILKFATMAFLFSEVSMASGWSGEWNRYLPFPLVSEKYNIQMKDGSFKLYKGQWANAQEVKDGSITVKHDGLTYGASVQTCIKNKTKQCIGVVDYVDGRNKYVLTEVGKGSDVTQSVCDIDYDKAKKSNGNATQSLKGCVSFTKASCQKWEEYTQSEFFKKFNDTAVEQMKQCDDFFTRLNAVNASLRQNFNMEQNTLEEVQMNFDKLTTNENRWFVSAAEVSAMKAPERGLVKNFRDIQDATINCQNARVNHTFKSSAEYAKFKQAELARLYESEQQEKASSSSGAQSVKSRR